MLSQLIFYPFTSIQNRTLVIQVILFPEREYKTLLRLDQNQANVIAAAHVQRITNQAIGTLIEVGVAQRCGDFLIINHIAETVTTEQEALPRRFATPAAVAWVKGLP